MFSITPLSFDASSPTNLREYPHTAPEFWGVRLGLDCRCCGFEERRPKLSIRVINFELTQHICPRYINVTDGQTDGRRTVAIPRFALPASCGKKRSNYIV